MHDLIHEYRKEYRRQLAQERRLAAIMLALAACWLVGLLFVF